MALGDTRFFVICLAVVALVSGLSVGCSARPAATVVPGGDASVAPSAASTYPGFTVYVGLDTTGVVGLRARIEALAGVANVSYFAPDAARKRYVRDLRSVPVIAQLAGPGVGGALVVRLSDPGDSASAVRIVRAIEQDPLFNRVGMLYPAPNGEGDAYRQLYPGVTKAGR